MHEDEREDEEDIADDNVAPGNTNQGDRNMMMPEADSIHNLPDVLYTAQTNKTSTNTKRAGEEAFSDKVKCIKAS